MKKLFTILISSLILTNTIFSASPKIPEGETDNVKDKLELPGDDFTYTFDITNESDKKVSFYVYSDWSDTKDPDVFYEIKVSAKSKNVYTYTVSKDMYDKYSFGYVYKDEKEGVNLIGGKAKFYDDAWMIVKEDLTFQYEYFGKITTYYLGKVDTFRLKMSTFFGNWQKFKKEQEKWEKERKRHGIINDFAASQKIQLEEADKGEDLTLTVQEKSEADSDTYTFTYDITNESDDQVSFYVYDAEAIGISIPFHEMKIPKHSSNIISYTVPKKWWNKLTFGYVWEENFALGGGTAEFYDGTKIVVTKDRKVEWEWVEPDFSWSKGYATNSAKTGWKGTNGKISTFSGDYNKYKTEKAKYDKKNLQYILVNRRDPETNRIIQDGVAGIYITEREAGINYQLNYYKSEGYEASEYIIVKTRQEAFKPQLFESEKKLVGKWQGLVNGFKTTLTLNKDKSYKLEFEDGAWEQWWWNADPTYINLQIFTTKEIMTVSYTLNGDVLSIADLGDWKRVK